MGTSANAQSAVLSQQQSCRQFSNSTYGVALDCKPTAGHSPPPAGASAATSVQPDPAGAPPQARLLGTAAQKSTSGSLPGPPPPLPGAWDLCRTTSALPSTTLPDRALEAVSALPGLSMCTKPYPLQHSAQTLGGPDGLLAGPQQSWMLGQRVPSSSAGCWAFNPLLLFCAPGLCCPCDS